MIIQLIENSYKGPIEGIWQNADASYRVGIRAENGPKPHPERDFVGFILKADSVYWMPGQVKFELKKCATPGKYSARYYMRDHSMQTDTAFVENGILQFQKLGAWYQAYPKKIEIPRKKGIFTLEILDTSTLLLVVPTMDESVRHQLDSLIKANKSLLARTPNLVIDCRNNGGGSDVTYRLLSPLLYTNRTTRYRAQVWATKDNAQKYEHLHHDKNYPLAFRLYGAWMKGRILRHQGQFIGKKGLVKNAKLKKQTYPQRIAVLINSRCASSCESFVEEARQSKKVTLIGEHTAGVSDYGNLHTLQLPCSGFVMRYPTTRSAAIDLGKGIDNIGFQPDINLQASNKDWVEFAREYLKNEELKTEELRN